MPSFRKLHGCEHALQRAFKTKTPILPNWVAQCRISFHVPVGVDTNVLRGPPVLRSQALQGMGYQRLTLVVLQPLVYAPHALPLAARQNHT